MSAAKILENIRATAAKRLEELRRRVPLLAGESSILRGTQGQALGGAIGGGKVISAVSANIDKLMARVQERRPNIIPAAMERIRTWQPGKRIMQLVPQVPGAQPAPAATAPEQPQPTVIKEESILRK